MNGIRNAFPTDTIIAEEDFASLTEMQMAVMTRYLHIEQRNNSTPLPILNDQTRRFWVIDPIDGTLGYINGRQYACCVALIEDGQVQMSVIGCPRLEVDGERGVLFMALRSHGAFIVTLHKGQYLKKLPP